MNTTTSITLKLLYGILTACGWILAACLGYVGLILFLFSAMLGPRGDIDYVDFTESQKHAANLQALLTCLLGMGVLGVALALPFVQTRALDWLLRRPRK